MTECYKCSETMPVKDDYERKLVFCQSEGWCTARFNGDYWTLDPMGDYATGGYIHEVSHWSELPMEPHDLV